MTVLNAKMDHFTTQFSGPADPVVIEMEEAIAKAELRLRQFRTELISCQQNVARWEKVVDELKAALRSVHGPVEKASARAESTEGKKPRIKWEEAFAAALQDVAEKDRPTKRGLMRRLYEMFPAYAQRYIDGAVYSGIRNGTIESHSDKVYLRGTYRTAQGES